MNSEARRKFILDLLKDSDLPEKGHILSERLGVTRQIIVKDIAILRASGENIISTPEGYLIQKSPRDNLRRIFAVCHDKDSIEDELMSIVKYGATVIDVIVEHPLYGEISGMLMIKSTYDVQNFMKKYKAYKAEPLSVLTGGLHLHTVEAEDETVFNNIEKELSAKGYLISG